VEDDVKSVLDWEVATLVGNKDGCQINGELVEGKGEGQNDLLGHQERDLKISPTLTSKQPYTNPTPVQFSFECTKPVLPPMDPNATLSKGQNPFSLAEIVKTKDIPY